MPEIFLRKLINIKHVNQFYNQLVLSWPAVQRFDEIRAKYGRKIKITNYHEEEWSIIESLSPDIKVKDILDEFNLRTHEQHTAAAELAQINARKKL